MSSRPWIFENRNPKVRMKGWKIYLTDTITKEVYNLAEAERAMKIGLRVSPNPRRRVDA